MAMDEATKQGVSASLARIPSGVFILTAAHEDRRTGMLASWVQQCGFEPPMITVAIGKGRPILPLISESRHFGLCQIAEGERMLMRKFAKGVEPNEDPFLGFDLVAEHDNHVPILSGSLSYMVCEVSCHIDVSGDHDLFVGQVLKGDYLKGKPHVHLRENGFSY